MSKNASFPNPDIVFFLMNNRKNLLIHSKEHIKTQDMSSSDFWKVNLQAQKKFKSSKICMSIFLDDFIGA